jgi:large subunit ribosomal protein L5
MSRLREKYQKEVAPALAKEFGYKNVMAIPKIEKVVVNMGLGEATGNAKLADVGADELGRITGQKAVVRRATKSIAQFKLRQGMPVGAMVTLRGERMWEFLDRLITIALPRVRDFRGVSPKGFDGRGNYTMGLRDQLMFPEIDYMKVDKARGMNVSVVTSAKTDEEARKLLQLMACPSGPTNRSKVSNGYDCEDCERSQDAEVQDPAAEPVPVVRPSSRLHAQVRDVPPLLPQAGARGRCHRRDEELLVRRRPAAGGRRLAETRESSSAGTRAGFTARCPLRAEENKDDRSDFGHDHAHP